MTTRRQFIKQSSLFGIGSVLVPEIFRTDQYKLGMQLYTVN